MPMKGFIPKNLRSWIDARTKYRLSHTQIQMARELGLEPKKFGSLGNTKDQPWKLPLSAFIEDIYFKRFKKREPENVKSIEQMIKDKAIKREESRAPKELEQSDDESRIT